MTDLQWLTCVQEWHVQLQKRHPLVDGQWRLTLWVFPAKIQQVQDVGDPGRSYRTHIDTNTQKK